jgi:hypothetical protein
MRTPLRLLGVLSVWTVVLPAEIIDQIAVTLDQGVITSSQIAEESRVTAFLNGEKPDLGPANRRRTADRLIEQTLVLREMDLTRYPQPSAAEVQEALKQVKSHFTGEEGFQRELAAHTLTAKQLEDALLRQITLLRFIDLRFRPEIQIQENDVLEYYDKVFVPAARDKGIAPVPSFEAARAQCEEALTAQLVDKRVDAWLKDARARARISYAEDAFQ